VNTTGFAASLSSSDYALSIDLKTSCLPNSGIAIAYAGRTDFDCAGSWRTVSVKLQGGKPTGVLADGSALAPFSYADVGRVSLAMRYSGYVIGSVDFVSKPTDIRFQSVFRSDNTADYKGTVDDSWLKDDRYGFTKAGDVFTMRLGALMANGKFALSFGKEPAALKNVLPDDAIDLDLRLDKFLVNTKVSPKLPIADKDDVVDDAFVFDQKFTLNAAVTGFGAMDAKVRWYEAGNFAATPFLIDYLGTGQIGGPPDDIADYPYKRLVNGTRVIGRFYPDHFVTEVDATMPCLPAMNCPAVSVDPAKPTFPVSGATYSRQPFTVTITPYGLARDGTPSFLSLFQNDSARPVALSAAKMPNDAAAPAAGVLTAPVLPTATDPADFKALKGAASFSTGNAYNPASRSVGDWGVPTFVYLRAGMTETILPSGSAAQVISSRTAANTWTPQYEDGLLIVPGRLFVSNAFGSDLLRLPVPLVAQYWNGTAWVASASDDDSSVASAIRPSAGGCRKFFAQNLVSGTCKTTPLTAATSAPVRLKSGKGTLLLLDPPRGTVGSVDYTLDSAAAPWLPSTQARATFGLYKSPLIYLREVY
jgi:MSHA biogenesis protein MshQ